MSTARLNHPVPVLRVNDLQASLDYYEKALGFKIEFKMVDFASVSRDKCDIFLCVGDQGTAPAWMWIPTDDADVLYAELSGRGAKIWNPPTNYPWGSCELHVADPDNNVLRFGSDLKPGAPTGRWRDMNGVAWLQQEDGKWKRVEG